MLSVEIRSRSYGAGKTPLPWVDHLGNRIEKLVFSKKYYSQYIPGHYPIESFGSLYRNIDNFAQSPLQSLTDWEISIPSVYSSKDGNFQTANLFYFLEYKNENENNDFDLIGCEAVLFDDADVIFRGAVDSLSIGTRWTAISIMESIGSPEIEKSDFPLVLGNASMLYWPVKFTKNEMNQDVIVISEKEIEKFKGFYIYLEKRNAFVPVSFNAGNQRAKFSAGLKTLVFLKPDDTVWFLEHDIDIGEPFLVDWRAADILRPEPNKSTPDNYTVGEDGNLESLQAWSHHRADDESDFAQGDFALSRALPRNQRYHSRGEAIKRVDDLRTSGIEIEINIKDYPVSLVAAGKSEGNSMLPRISGDPAFFLETSRTEKVAIPLDLAKYPTAALSRCVVFDLGGRLGEMRIFHHGTVSFIAEFPELDLPSSACVIEYSFKYNFYSSCDTSVFFYIGDTARSEYLSGGRFQWIERSVKPSSPLPISATRRVSFFFSGMGASDVIDVALLGFNISFKIRMPFDEGKLYAGGEIAGLANPYSGKSIIPSVAGLLAAAQIGDYSIRAIGELSNIEYGSIVNNEAALFRNKLKELAAESATLIKFSPTEKTFLVKSVSRQFGHDAVLIPLNAIALENNIYDFKMESPCRGDVLNGILISWGKNVETGKYEHSLSIDSRGVSKDGELQDTRDSILSDKWPPVREQLWKNSTSAAGITKSMDSKWIMDWDGAELMAYNYLCWNSAPLRKAQVKCIIPVLRSMGDEIDIGSFVYLNLPGYPEKLAKTAWVITGKHDDLDKMVSTLELLEAWNSPVIHPDRFLLLESGMKILTETGQKIRLEGL